MALEQEYSTSISPTALTHSINSEPEPTFDSHNGSSGDIYGADSQRFDKDGGMKAKFSQILTKAKGQLALTSSADDSDQGKVVLKKEITPLSGVGFVVGQLIGSGIFITPSHILSYTGSFGLSLMCWLIGGVVALAGALCYFELGLLVRKTGGEYAILLEAYSFRKKNRWVEMLGSLIAFLFTWASVIVLRGASVSIITLTCARYLTRPFFINCDSDVPESVVKLLALTFLIILILVNIYSVRLTTRVAVLFSSLKLLAVAFIVAVGIITVIIRHRVPEELHRPFQPLLSHEPTASTVALALYGVMWAYDGWNVMNYAIEEMKNVKRTMSVSLFVGVPIVTLCYALVNVSFFVILSYEEILLADAVALSFGEATLGKAGLVVISIMVALSTFGTANLSIYASSRLTFGAARDGLLPDCLSGLHTKYKTPAPALVLLTCIATIMISVGDIGELIDAFSGASFVFYLLVFIGLVIMRFTYRHEPRPFKAYFIIPVAVFAILSSIFLVVLPIFLQPTPTLIAFGTILIGIPVYIFLVMETPWRLRPKILDRLSNRISWHVNNLMNTQSSRESVTD